MRRPCAKNAGVGALSLAICLEGYIWGRPKTAEQALKVASESVPKNNEV